MPQPTSRFQSLIKPSRLVLSLLLALASPMVWSANNAMTDGAPTMTGPSAEFVYKYLLGEVAAQRGEYVLAGQLFLDLAKQTRNAALAERATQASALARVPQLALPSAALWAELAPDSMPAAEAASQLFIAGGDLKQALPQIQKVLSRENLRANAFMELNGLLSRLPNKKEVLEAVQTLAKPYPNLPEAHFAIAQAAYFDNNLNLWDAELNEASRLRPQWEAPVQMRGQVLGEKDPQQAVDFYRAFLKRNPESDQVRLLLARTLLSQKNVREAKVEFSKLADKHKNNPEMNVIVGLLALDAKEYELADRAMQTALNAGFKEPNKLYFNLGRSAAEQKKDTQALEWFNQITPGEQYFAGRLAAAPILARTQGVDKAIAMLDDVDGLTLDQQAVVIQTEAMLLNQAKRTEEAFNLLQKANQNLPNNTDVMYDFALSAERMGKFDIMEQTLYKLIKLKPDSAAAYNALGYSYADRNIKLIEAKNLIETAVKLAPNDHYIMDSLGWVYYRLGDLQHASEQLRQAFAMQQDPEIAAHLVEVLWKQGNQDEARALLERALKAYPDNEVLASTAQKLKFSL